MGTSENLVTNTSSSHMRGAGERLRDREERSEFRGTCGGKSIAYMNTNIPSLLAMLLQESIMKYIRFQWNYLEEKIQIIESIITQCPSLMRREGLANRLG